MFPSKNWKNIYSFKRHIFFYITDGAAKTFGKIEQENMPEIDRLLGKLNVTLATFIMDPGILFTFFGDPEKAQIMMEVE